MPTLFPCPYLNANVELTEEREAHIAAKHGDLLPRHLELVSQALRDPDAVHTSRGSPDTLLFSRWYDELRGGKFVLAVVASNRVNGMRYWIVTAHMLRKPVPGEALWRRS